MIQLPDKRPETGPLGLDADRRAINAIIDYLRAITPKDSPTVKVNISDVGTTFDGANSSSNTKSPCPYG